MCLVAILENIVSENRSRAALRPLALYLRSSRATHGSDRARFVGFSRVRYGALVAHAGAATKRVCRCDWMYVARARGSGDGTCGWMRNDATCFACTVSRLDV